MDSYTYCDSHFVGDDGFVVPGNFNEFFARFPQLVLSSYVRRRRQHGADDLESELLLYLMTLPQRSKYREAGLTDRIQSFDPARSYGASRARWQNWLNSLLHNRLCSLMRQLAPRASIWTLSPSYPARLGSCPRRKYTLLASPASRKVTDLALGESRIRWRWTSGLQWTNGTGTGYGCCITIGALALLHLNRASHIGLVGKLLNRSSPVKSFKAGRSVRHMKWLQALRDSDV